MYVGKFSGNADMTAVFNRNMQSANERTHMDKEVQKKDDSDVSIKYDRSKLGVSKNNFNKVDLLNAQKERMQNRMEALSSRLAEIAVSKDSLLYEEQTIINENGEEQKIKAQRVLSSKEKDILEKYENQELSINKTVNDLTKELSEMNEKITAAQAAEMKKNIQENKKAEVNRDNSGEDKDLSDDEKQAEHEKEQMNFFAETDSVKKYVRQGRLLRAQMQVKKGHLESTVATDRFNEASSKQRADASLAASSIQTGDLSPEEAASKRASAYNAIGTTPDTSILTEKANISAGNFNANESGVAKELAKVHSAIEGLTDSIDLQIAKINKKISSNHNNNVEKNTLATENDKNEKKDAEKANKTVSATDNENAVKVGGY